MTHHSVTSVTGISVMDVLCWRAGGPTPTLAIGSVAALLKLTRVPSLVQNSGQGLPRTAGLGQHPGQGLPRTAGLAGEIFSVCHVDFGCFFSGSCFLTLMHNVTSCTVSHHAC